MSEKVKNIGLVIGIILCSLLFYGSLFVGIVRARADELVVLVEKGKTVDSVKLTTTIVEEVNIADIQKQIEQMESAKANLESKIAKLKSMLAQAQVVSKVEEK